MTTKVNKKNKKISSNKGGRNCVELKKESEKGFWK
jgi:hypothetical protein